MKQTAVEYLVEEFKQRLIGENLPNWVIKIIDQAKQMEKEQIKDAYQKGFIRELGNRDEDAKDLI